MLTTLKLPKSGLTMEEGAITRWLKQEGDRIEEGDVLYEVETDKTVLEVQSSAGGILRKILLRDNELVPVGTPVAVLSDDPDEDLEALVSEGANLSAPSEEKQEIRAVPEAGSSESAVVPDSGIRALPKVKKIAKERGIDLSLISGTGPGGRITEEDLDSIADGDDAGDGELVPMTPSRLGIAKKMAAYKQECPHTYCFVELDMTALLQTKQSLPFKATVTDLMVCCLARTVAKHPIMNASVQGNQLFYPRHVNVGIAAAGGRGLVMPVIRRAELLSLKEICRERSRLVELAREGILAHEDMEGGTISMSNLGMYGVTAFSAVIHPPQSTMLALGAIKKRVVATEDDSIQIRPIMVMTMSGDHRARDGSDSMAFVQDLVNMVENGVTELAITEH